MTNELIPAWVDVDTFLGNGGTYRYIKNPTQEDINPYVSYLTGHQNANIDPEKGKFYTLALHGLSASVKDTYPNPQLLLALNSLGSVCSIVFFYEINDQGRPFNWVDAWAGDGTTGASPFLMFTLGDMSGKSEHDIKSVPTPEGMASGPMLIHTEKDPETKWLVMTVEKIAAIALSQKDAALATEHFSKIYEPTLEWTEQVIGRAVSSQV